MTENATTTIQVAEVGMFTPPERYSTLVLVNRSNAAMHSDAVEMHVVLTPVIDEVQ